MTFNASKLPVVVQKAFYDNSLDWHVAYWKARENGISDWKRLTDILFYKAHHELTFPGGSVLLKPGMKNFNALKQEWINWKKAVESLSHGSPSPAKDENWEPYNKSSYPDSKDLSSAVKTWLAETPKHTVEAGIFNSNRRDNGNILYFLAWKTTDPAHKCLTHNAHDNAVLHGWFELETSLKALKAKPADSELLAKMPQLPFGKDRDTGFLGIAAVKLFVNIRMIRHVYNSGLCLKNSANRAWREAREDGKQTIENVKQMLEIASGAKGGRRPGASSYGKPVVGGVKRAVPENAFLHLKDGKGFLDKLEDINRGKFGKGSNVHTKTIYEGADRRISGDADGTIGWIRHFD
jgi:hypothetical protein